MNKHVFSLLYIDKSTTKQRLDGKSQAKLDELFQNMAEQLRQSMAEQFGETLKSIPQATIDEYVNNAVDSKIAEALLPKIEDIADKSDEKIIQAIQENLAKIQIDSPQIQQMVEDLRAEMLDIGKSNAEISRSNAALAERLESLSNNSAQRTEAVLNKLEKFAAKMDAPAVGVSQVGIKEMKKGWLCIKEGKFNEAAERFREVTLEKNDLQADAYFGLWLAESEIKITCDSFEDFLNADCNLAMLLENISGIEFADIHKSLDDEHYNNACKWGTNEQKAVYVKLYDVISTSLEGQREKEKDEIEKEKERQKREQEKNKKNRKKNIIAYVLYFLAAALSAAVVTMTFKLPWSSFSDYTGWLFVVVFALAGILGVVSLWHGSNQIVDRLNSCFGILGILISAYLFLGSGAFLNCWMLDKEPLWLGLFVGITVVGIILFILIMVKDKKSFAYHKDAILHVVVVAVLLPMFLAFAVGTGARSLPRGTHYSKNSDGSYTYILDGEVGDLVIPDEYKGKPVTGVKTFTKSKLVNIKSLYIPESVTNIEFGALSGCGQLESLTIPFVGFKEVGGVIDYDGEAEFIKPLGYIFGDDVFDGAVATKQMFFGKYISGESEGEESNFFVGTYYIPQSLKSVTVLGGTIYNGAFSNCENIENITLGNDVTGIGDYAFQNCKGLTSFTIPDSVTSVGRNVFEGCDDLIKTENGVKYVDKWAVKCDTINPIEFLSDTVGIADYFMVIDWSVESVVLPEGLKYIGESAFYCDISEIEIPQSVVKIGANAFTNCEKLEAVTFDSVDGWYADDIALALSDPASAAQLLSETYCNKEWLKKE